MSPCSCIAFLAWPLACTCSSVIAPSMRCCGRSVCPNSFGNDLPGALITCAEIDPLRDEAIEYALRLLRAGVSTELHVFPATCHGFDSLLPDLPASRRLFALQGDALRRVWDDA